MMIAVHLLVGSLVWSFAQTAPDPTLKRRLEDPSSWCGNCMTGKVFAERVRKALSMESDGKHSEAVRVYFRALMDCEDLTPIDPDVVLQIAELYDRAGQQEDLKSILKFEENRYEEAVPPFPLLFHRDATESATKSRKTLGYPPSLSLSLLRRSLALLTWEREKDWKKLVDVLRTRREEKDGVLFSESAARGETLLATRLLARHPDEAVPLLKAAADSGFCSDYPSMYLALGFCGTDDALTFLAARAAKEPYMGEVDALVSALILAGERGRPILADLAQQGSDGMKKGIRKYQNRRPHGDSVLSFPSIPARLQLPAQWTP